MECYCGGMLQVWEVAHAHVFYPCTCFEADEIPQHDDDDDGDYDHGACVFVPAVPHQRDLNGSLCCCGQTLARPLMRESITRPSEMRSISEQLAHS